MSNCLSDWGKKIQACNGDTQCLENCAKELRESLDIVFPPSTKIEIESDKINYMLSTIFFLSNRLAKAMVGLSEFDKAINNLAKTGKQSIDTVENKQVYETMTKELNNILAKHF